MLVGNPKSFAIESTITDAFPNVSQRALGYFVLHVAGNYYGVRDKNASLLGCSYCEVHARLSRRGTHCMPCLSDLPASVIVESYLDAIYRDTVRNSYFGMPKAEYERALHENGVLWAPDGDAAFDDGSHVLQFDIDDRVRIIAFKNGEPAHISDTTKEIWIDSRTFYETLENWSEQFSVEWLEMLSE